jgi:uncharacterized repeat protein (TIGR03803 family)
MLISSFRRQFSHPVGWVYLLLFLCLPILTLSGTTVRIEPVHVFQKGPDHPYGGLIRGKDGNYYGTSMQGGSFDKGTIFRMSPGGRIKILFQFDGNKGESPRGTLLDGGDGYLYGTTSLGGAQNKGTVFKISLKGELVSLASFGGINGAYPFSGLTIGNDGNFYGTTVAGGANDLGTIFRVTRSGEVTKMADFAANGCGYYPMSGLIRDAEGNLLGITPQGGANNLGSIYKFSSTGNLSPVANLNAKTGGFTLGGLTRGPDENYYGVTMYGGAFRGGVIFRLSPDGSLSTLAEMGDAEHPFILTSAITCGRDGCLYGMAQFNNVVDEGCMYRVTMEGQTTIVARFYYTSLTSFYSAMIQDRENNFYGTHGPEASGDPGGIFKIHPKGTLKVLAEFRQSEGMTPAAGLVTTRMGTLYGTTSEGGYGNGTIFKISRSGKFRNVLKLKYPMGHQPRSALIQGSDGNLYGTTMSGGIYGGGTILKISTMDRVTKLHDFNYPEAMDVYSSLVQGKDGYFYGAGAYGGPDLQGGLFKISRKGQMSPFYSFLYQEDGPNPYYPYAGLVQASDGNFYGACSVDGGSIAYRITPDGKFTQIAQFGEEDGSWPTSSMTLGVDGNLYGTTAGGGPRDAGTLYRLTTEGELTTLHSFQITDGMDPQGPLVQAWDGNFYGVTNVGGTHDAGTIFQMTPEGTVTKLYDFDTTHGSHPLGGSVSGQGWKPLWHHLRRRKHS